jgi:hypothetical protein
MNITSNWWIGDRLRIRATGEIAFFQGMESPSMVRIRLESGILKNVEVGELEFMGDEKLPANTEWSYPDVEDDPQYPLISKSIGNSIDLHYEQLKQHYPHTDGSILEFQLESCQAYIRQALEAKKSPIKIIYGKGQGILKAEVERMLRKWESYIQFQSSHPDGASIDIWLR